MLVLGPVRVQLIQLLLRGGCEQLIAQSWFMQLLLGALVQGCCQPIVVIVKTVGPHDAQLDRAHH
jgi:hypothetical protein